jgi:hypothetical protein
MRKTEMIVWTAVGAVVGGSITGLLALWFGGSIIPTKCMVVTFSRLMGTFGSVIGVICGAAVGICSDKRAGTKVAAYTGGLIILLSIAPIWLYTIFRPCLSPKPYPGSLVTKREMYIGSGWHNRIQTYTTIFSIDSLEQHYAKQMNHYCISVWQFEDQPASEHGYCRRASCQIRSGADPQSFQVSLCPVTETQIKVIQEDIWETD